MTSPNRRAFILMPFTGELEDIYRLAIRPALEDLGYEVARADTVFSTGLIIRDILQHIADADLIVADLTGRNPNVFYEVAVAHTLGKPVVMLAQDYQDVPFDLKSYRMIVYESRIGVVEKLRRDLRRAVGTIKSGDSHSNPIRDFLPQFSSPEELDKLKREARSLRLELVACMDSKTSLERELLDGSKVEVKPEELIRELINNEAVKSLQLQLFEKQHQIEELIAAPSNADARLRSMEHENRRLQDELQRMRSRMQVLPHWGIPPVQQNDSYVFVLMPFHEEWSDIVWEVIRSTILSEGLECERADEKTGKFIMRDIWSGINAARIVIADLTLGNPNVTYEVGMCDVLGKDQILLAQNPKDVPFGFLGIRLIPYSYVHGGIGKLKDDLRTRIRQTLNAG
jgi:nucleoside 2-deoxyribosyltransferase